MNPAHRAYWDAEFADALYSKTIRDIYGSTVTRWTLTSTQSSHPEVRTAFQMKQLADDHYLLICRLLIILGERVIQ